MEATGLWRNTRLGHKGEGRGALVCSWSSWWKCHKQLLAQGDTEGTDK